MKWRVMLVLLPELDTIQFYGDYTLQGDSNQNTTSIAPYNFTNTMTMKSETKNSNERLDLPSLAQIKGQKYHFQNIGIVILESES